MNKKLYISRKITGLSGRLDYYLTESTYEESKTIVYGVEINKISVDNSGIEQIKKKCVNDLSADRERVLEFLYMLGNMEVMPESLEDIAKDLVSEDFFINFNIREKSA